MDPAAIDLRMYNVGFGDCFLLSFSYDRAIDGRNVRHVLIDFGTKALPKGGASLRDIAQRIAADCAAKLDVVVVTHRHQDHLSGFTPAVGGELIAGLQPDRVLRPWTEEPGVTDIDDAIAAADTVAAKGLAAGQGFARAVAELRYPTRPTAAQAQMRALAQMQVHDAEATGVLDAMSEHGRGRYLRLGGDPDTTDLLPGVRIRVLGPPDPTVAQDLYHYAGTSQEYWLRLSRDLPGPVEASMLGSTDEQDQGLAPPAVPPPGPTRWLVDRLERQHVRSAFALIQAFDKVLNDTSLILLIEAAGHTMLFPGDAQWEDWAVCLNTNTGARALHDDLRRVDLYKVGHHGSRDATPKLSLFPLLKANETGKPLVVMSTLEGFFKDIHPVPAKALVDDLSSAPFRLARTDRPATPPPMVVRFHADGANPFNEVPV